MRSDYDRECDCDPAFTFFPFRLPEFGATSGFDVAGLFGDFIVDSFVNRVGTWSCWKSTSERFGLGFTGGRGGEGRSMIVCWERGRCGRADIRGRTMRARVVVNFIIGSVRV